MESKLKKTHEPVFSKRDLVNNATVFGVSPELMAGALFNVEEATEAEARRRIEEFSKREV